MGTAIGLTSVTRTIRVNSRLRAGPKDHRFKGYLHLAEKRQVVLAKSP
jgi:hypothetical protein